MNVLQKRRWLGRLATAHDVRKARDWTFLQKSISFTARAPPSNPSDCTWSRELLATWGHCKKFAFSMRNQARRLGAHTGGSRPPRAAGAQNPRESPLLSTSPKGTCMETVEADSSPDEQLEIGMGAPESPEAPDSQDWVNSDRVDLTFVAETAAHRRVSAPVAVRQHLSHPYLSLAPQEEATDRFYDEAEEEEDEDSFVSSTNHGEDDCEASDGSADQTEQMRPLIRAGIVDVENAADSSTAGSCDEIGPARQMRSMVCMPENDFLELELATQNHRDLASKAVSDSVLVFEYTLRDVSKLLRPLSYRHHAEHRGAGGLASRHRVTSPWLQAFGFQWRLLIFPRGNADMEGKWMSVFLECSPLDTVGEEQKKSWRSHARFQLALKNQTGACAHVIRREMAGHMFSPRENDWGFQEFIQCVELENPRFGWTLNDQIVFRVWVEFDKDSYTFSEQYDSKKETGFVGLKNQGATCYMNSLLQTLFNIGAFRRAVYELPLPPIEEDTPESVDQGSTKNSAVLNAFAGTPLTFALQRVFYDLQHEDQCVSTKELTNAFGWTDADAFTQHDAQELNRLLCDTLEERMKGTPLEGTIARLFQGQAKRFIKCVHVNFESAHDECFYDLSLNVKGCKDLYDSFRKYVEVETLEGDNKYYADGFGLQDAKMGVKFMKLPPILQLHLKRFEYDFNRDMMVKINDRYEFFPEIKLGEFVDGSAGPDDEEYIYVLHAVLVHMGDVHGGHYHAYIRPDPTSDDNLAKWFKFDDERVIRVTASEAIEDNFGAPLTSNGVAFPPQRRFTNAYMLQYVRKRDAHVYLGALSEIDVPESLRRRIAVERELDERKIREREELRQMMNIRLITPALEMAHNGLDWADLNSGVILRVRRSMLLGEFKQMLLREVLIPEGADPNATAANETCNGDACQRMLVWSFVARINQTVRPSRLLNDGNDDEPLERAWNERAAARTNHHASPGNQSSSVHAANLFIDIRREPVRLAALFDKRECLMLFKWYEPAAPPETESPELRVLGWDIVPMQMTMQNLTSALKEQNMLPRVPLSELYWYEEVTGQEAKEIPDEVTLGNVRNQLQSGDIIIFGRRIPKRLWRDETMVPTTIQESSEKDPQPLSAASLLVSILQEPTLTLEERAAALYRYMFIDARDYLRHRCDVRLVPLGEQRLGVAGAEEHSVEEQPRNAPAAGLSSSDGISSGEILLRNVSTQLTQYGLGVLLVSKLKHLEQHGLDLSTVLGIHREDLRPNRVRFHRRGFASLDDYLYPRDSDPLPMAGADSRKLLESIVSKQRAVKLYYEIIDTDAEEFEGKQEVSITWRSTPVDMIGRKLLLALPPQATYGDLVEVLLSKLPEPERTTLETNYAGIRVHELWQKKIIAGVVSMDRPVTVLGHDSNRENFEILAEPLPRDETAEALARHGCVLIRVAHVSKGSSTSLYGMQQDTAYGTSALPTVNSFGLPFVLRVPSPRTHGAMPVQQLHALIQERLALPESEFRHWRLLYVRPAERSPVIYLQPEGSDPGDRAGRPCVPEANGKQKQSRNGITSPSVGTHPRPGDEQEQASAEPAEMNAVSEGVSAETADGVSAPQKDMDLVSRGLVDLQDCVVDSDDSYIHNFIGLEHHDSAATKRRATSRLRYMSDKPLKIT
jgi:ubiquitin C-terminal hydrolase